MITKIKAFITGMIEFKNSFTTRYENYDLTISYEHGRNLSHKLTFNRYED
jgi:hypothetical protein